MWYQIKQYLKILKQTGSLVKQSLKILKNLALRGHLLRRIKINKYLKDHKRARVQFGGGSRILPGWLTTDLFGAIPVDICRRLPFPDQSLDLIYSSHLIEHVPVEELKKFLRDSKRCLKQGGQHIIATPSLTKISRIWYGNPGCQPDELHALKERYGKIIEPELFCGSTHINMITRSWGHFFIYDKEYLCHLALGAGYSEIIEVDNLDVPDKALKSYLERSKPKRWHLETMTLNFTK